MGLFAQKSVTTTTLDENKVMSMTQLIDFLGIKGTASDNLSEATYFSCLKILAESLGKMPLKLLQKMPDGGVVEARDHPLYPILRYRPNKFTNSTDFFGTIELVRNHYGNAYVWIKGVGANTSLWLLPSDCVTIKYDETKDISANRNLWYLYKNKITGKLEKLCQDEVLHFRTSMCFDGLKGLSVQDILKETIGGGLKSQKALNKLYESGFTAKAVLNYIGDLNDSSVRTYVKGIEKYAKGEMDDMSSIIPIPIGASLTPLNIKLTDAQFLELRKYSALQIASAFGIKPNQINDYEKASYASAEMQQLAFYIDTLLYVLKKYEEELMKLLSAEDIRKGYYLKFNAAVILRADNKTQIETLAKAVSTSIYTPNEARALLDKSSRLGGDSLLANGSMIPVEMAGQQYSSKGGDSE